MATPTRATAPSTFINHLLQRRVQQTGVAPTDDSFTIIQPGRDDEVRLFASSHHVAIIIITGSHTHTHSHTRAQLLSQTLC